MFLKPPSIAQADSSLVKEEPYCTRVPNLCSSHGGADKMALGQRVVERGRGKPFTNTARVLTSRRYERSIFKMREEKWERENKKREWKLCSSKAAETEPSYKSWNSVVLVLLAGMFSSTEITGFKWRGEEEEGGRDQKTNKTASVG